MGPRAVFQVPYVFFNINAFKKHYKKALETTKWIPRGARRLNPDSIAWQLGGGILWFLRLFYSVSCDMDSILWFLKLFYSVS